MTWVALFLWFIAFSLIGLIGNALLAWIGVESSQIRCLLSKAGGLAAFTAFLWIAGYLPGDFLTRMLELALLAIGSLAAVLYLRRSKASIGELLRFEMLFAGLVLAFLIARGFLPTVTDGEKPMDLMLLSSSMRATHLPPEDAWFARHPVNYYYYGLFCFGQLGKVVGASPFQTFNFGLASTWALILMALGAAGGLTTKSWRGSVLLPAIYALIGNLGAAAQLWGGGTGEFNWWAPSRTVPAGITEFPAFSYLFGDFHPHMINHVWLSLFLVLALIYRKQEKPSTLIPFGALAGIIFATNTWSMICVLLLATALLPRSAMTLTKVASATLCFALITVPYVMKGERTIDGLALVTQRSSGTGFALHWAILAVGATAALTYVRESVIPRLILVSLALIALPEFVYIASGDGLGRTNTLFKFWWDAWLVLAIVSSWGYFALQTSPVKRLVAAVSLTAGAIYLPLSLPVRFRRFETWYGIDPATYTFAKYPYLASPYQRLLTQQPASYFEAPGLSYSKDSLLAAFTGIPTMLGWIGHERLWRANSAEFREIQRLALIAGRNGVSPELQQRYQFEFVHLPDPSQGAAKKFTFPTH